MKIYLSLGPVFCADILQFLCCWWLRCGGCVHKKCWIRSSLPWPHSADTIRQLIRHTAGEDIVVSCCKHQLKLVNLWSTIHNTSLCHCWHSGSKTHDSSLTSPDQSEKVVENVETGQSYHQYLNHLLEWCQEEQRPIRAQNHPPMRVKDAGPRSLANQLLSHTTSEFLHH